jgi:hypothetical protein
VVEKYLKALLALHGIEFPKTHNLRQLAATLPSNVPVDLSSDEQDELTGYATAARYPGWGDISLTDARKAVAIARRVRREIRKLLPKKALSRSRIGPPIARWIRRKEQNMPLLSVVIVLVVVGVVMYLINNYVPMASSIKTILNIVVVVVVCIWLLQAFGLWGRLSGFRLSS